MDTKTTTIAIGALFVGMLLGATVDGGWHHGDRERKYDKKTETEGQMHQMADGSMMHNEDMGMMHGMDHSDMMVESERDFLEGMIPHHQEAVDTAKEVLERGGTTPEIKTLVQNIITAQEAEIVSMKTWYQSWYSQPYQSNGDYKPMMRDLEKLSGAELDRAFLEDMIMHHMGALMMARGVESHIEHQEITDLTKVILKTQTEEIQLMRQLLTGF